MSRSLEKELPERCTPTWHGLDQGLQSTLRKTVANIRDYGGDVSLAQVLDMVKDQTLPGELVMMTRCAATGLVLQPAGLTRPYVHLIEPDNGYTPGNMVLVSNAYYALRRVTRSGGTDGHAKVMRFIAEASQVPKHELKDRWCDFAIDPEPADA